ncbi:hypothetical protein [Yersinia enterocolitica]|uniref:hypothetical protein n=1 Tax=Yersinia enterocolitica TaxID=630 RepID=UPI002AC461FD|nr:hypothetical protein [Yersinia enterocolitica]
MKYLLHTLMDKKSNGDIFKYEIYIEEKNINHHEKIPEGTCRVIAYKFEAADSAFKIIDIDLNVQRLFDENKANPNTWYSDGNDRVNVNMLINYLQKL